MTTSYTTTASETFSLASARYVASKIATDLRQFQRYYGTPSDADITNYAFEAAILAYHGCVEKVIYGFKRNGNWILTLEYTCVNGTLTADDRPAACTGTPMSPARSSAATSPTPGRGQC